MKYIFPTNYNFKNKLFGFMDYSTAVFNVLWALFTFIFINILPITLNIKIGVFITLCFPLLLFSFFGFNNENIIVRFIFMEKIDKFGFWIYNY